MIKKLPKAVKKTLRHLQVVSYLLHRYFREQKRINPPVVIDGNDVMQTMKIPPGPEVGKILNFVREAQAEGKITSYKEGIEYLTNKVSKKTKNHD